MAADEDALARDKEASVVNMLLHEIKEGPGIEPVSNLVPILTVVYAQGFQ
jgi:hypothetical protein